MVWFFDFDTDTFMTQPLYAPITPYIAEYSRCIFDKIWQKNTGFSRPEEILERFNCQATDTMYFIKRQPKQLKIKQWKTTKLKIKKY